MDSDDESYDSSYETSDASDATDAATEDTFASIEAALTSFADRMQELEDTLSDVTHTMTALPISTVAIGNFQQPRFLESAPFRQTVFRLRPAAQAEYGLVGNTATFAELCAAIRKKCAKADDFLDALHHLDRIVE